MRRRNREINIFNLSMLDVIAGAMAALLAFVPFCGDRFDWQAEIAPSGD